MHRAAAPFVTASLFFLVGCGEDERSPVDTTLLSDTGQTRTSAIEFDKQHGSDNREDDDTADGELAEEKSGWAVPDNDPACEGSSGSVPPAFSGALRQLCSKAIEEENRVASNHFRYHVTDSKIQAADVDGDGLSDLVISLHLCERSACHPTTHASLIGLIYGTPTGAREGPHSIVGGHAEIITAGRSSTFETLEFGPDDPGCCPTAPRIHRLPSE